MTFGRLDEDQDLITIGKYSFDLQYCRRLAEEPFVRVEIWSGKWDKSVALHVGNYVVFLSKSDNAGRQNDLRQQVQAELEKSEP